MANHYETSPPIFRNAPLKFILYLLLIPVFGLGLFLLLWWYIDNKNKLLSIEGDLMKWQEGIFNKTFIDLSTDDIRTVKIKQSFSNVCLVQVILIFTPLVTRLRLF